MPALWEAKTRLKHRLTLFKLVTHFSAHTADYFPQLSVQNQIHMIKKKTVFKPGAID